MGFLQTVSHVLCYLAFFIFAATTANPDNVADGTLGVMQQNLAANQLVWMSVSSSFVNSVDLPESIQNGIKEMDFIGDQVLAGLDISVMPELLPLVLTWEEA